MQTTTGDYRYKQSSSPSRGRGLLGQSTRHGRLIFISLVMTGAAPLLTSKANAADESKAAIQLVAQQPPGSLSETISRIWADCAARQLGRPIFVVNKPGANGVVAVNYLKSQPADGRTAMTIGMSQMTITPYVYKNAPYNPESDFENITVLTTSSLFLVASAKSGIRRLSELAAASRAVQGGANYGSPGKGSPAHLLTAAVMQLLTSPATHVPFVGEAAGVHALLRGDIDLMTLTSGSAAPLLRTGQAAPLAIYAKKRDKAFPDVPTIVELTGNTDLARPGWLALVVKAGTPSGTTEGLRAATARCASSDKEYRARLSRVSVTPVQAGSEDVESWVRRDTAVFRPLITRLGLVE